MTDSACPGLPWRIYGFRISLRDSRHPHDVLACPTRVVQAVSRRSVDIFQCRLPWALPWRSPPGSEGSPEIPDDVEATPRAPSAIRQGGLHASDNGARAPLLGPVGTTVPQLLRFLGPSYSLSSNSPHRHAEGASRALKGRRATDSFGAPLEQQGDRCG